MGPHSERPTEDMSYPESNTYIGLKPNNQSQRESAKSTGDEVIQCEVTNSPGNVTCERLYMHVEVISTHQVHKPHNRNMRMKKKSQKLNIFKSSEH